MITWYAGVQPYLDAVAVLGPTSSRGGATTGASLQAWCAWCGQQVDFHLAGDAASDGQPNLRENMRCGRCQLTNRQRLVACAISESAADARASIALLEQATRLFRSVKKRHPNTIGSEYLGAGRQGGRRYVWRSSPLRFRHTRHEDITRLSYASDSLAVIAHSDVLEHVFDYRAALRECFRVLAPGGSLLFTVPFFYDNAMSILRGHPNPDGSLTHLETPEYHGDGVGGTGIYTFHSFGQDLLDEIRAAGFASANIGVSASPPDGLAINKDRQAPRDMQTIVFRATKPLR